MLLWLFVLSGLFCGLLAWGLIGLCIDIPYLLVNFMFVASTLLVAEIYGWDIASLLLCWFSGWVYVVSEFISLVNCQNQWMSRLPQCMNFFNCLNCLNVASSGMYKLLQCLHCLNSLNVWMFQLLNYLNSLNNLLASWEWKLYAWMKCFNWCPQLNQSRIVGMQIWCIEMKNMVLLIDILNMWTSMYECLTVSACGYFLCRYNHWNWTTIAMSRPKKTGEF